LMSSRVGLLCSVVIVYAPRMGEFQL
jgi:hypothetical protein